MNPATPSVSTQGIGEALAKGTGQGGTGTGSGTGNGTGTGTGSGTGSGNGTGTGTGTGNGSAEGTYLAGGNALPKGSRVLLIVDNSGSIESRKKIASKVKKEIKRHDKANKTVEIKSSLLSHIIPSIKAGIKSKYNVIIWITDLQDHAYAEYHFFEKNYEEYTKIEELLQQAGVKFFITSFESEPASWLAQIVKSSGGSFSIQMEDSE